MLANAAGRCGRKVNHAGGQSIWGHGPRHGDDFSIFFRRNAVFAWSTSCFARQHSSNNDNFVPAENSESSLRMNFRTHRKQLRAEPRTHFSEPKRRFRVGPVASCDGRRGTPSFGLRKDRPFQNFSRSLLPFLLVPKEGLGVLLRILWF